ncbi:MAG TPA: hypothetical protein VNG29_02075 [Candidatus Paceibacterota bacterium]|nr:hypothetical protein [Candidatus Paceibacterota bacterium]
MDARHVMKFARAIFRAVIAAYPASYRKHFKESLLQTFDDMREDAAASDWFIIRDAIASIPMQYVNYFHETMKIKFKNLPAAIAGAALLLPFALLVAIAAPAQLLYKLGYANPVNVGIGQIIGTHVGLGTVILIFFPIAAFLINFVALIWAGFRDRELTVKQFVAGNVFSIVIMILGFGFALFLPFHDAIPCFVQGIWQNGFNNFLPLMNACRNA